MRRIRTAIAGVTLPAALMCSTMPASSQVLARSVYYKVVSPGADVTVGMFYGVNPDCTSTGDYHIDLLIAPKNGQIFIDKRAIRIIQPRMCGPSAIIASSSARG